MRAFDRTDVRDALPWRQLIDGLRETFRTGCVQPLRTVHQVKVPGEPDASFFMMPAWQEGGKLAVKILFICPGNANRDLPAVNGSIVVFDAVTGAPEAILEGSEVTARRTAAASALAAEVMARQDVRSLLVAGAGTIAANLIPAHRTVRDYERVTLWARDRSKAQALADELGEGVAVADDLDAAVAEADVVSTATLASVPLIKGALVKEGTHLDLVGAYLPTMAEADAEALRRAAGAIIVDTFDGALAEAGDIIQAIDAGAITRDDIAGDLAALCRGEVQPRTDDRQITLFKSVGAAIEDFAAARMAATR